MTSEIKLSGFVPPSPAPNQGRPEAPPATDAAKTADAARTAGGQAPDAVQKTPAPAERRSDRSGGYAAVSSEQARAKPPADRNRDSVELGRPREAAADAGAPESAAGEERGFFRFGAEKERDGQPVTEEDARRTTERINRQLANLKNRSVRYHVHEQTGQMYVDIVDDETDTVIRSIPPEEMLDRLAKVEQYLGLIFDRKA